MRLRLQCQVGKSPNEDVAAHEAVTEDVDMANPRATVKMLRAAAAIKFRLPIHNFVMHYAGSRDAVNLTNEDVLLSECGLRDDDLVLLLSRKRWRELSDAGTRDMVTADDERAVRDETATSDKASATVATGAEVGTASVTAHSDTTSNHTADTHEAESATMPSDRTAPHTANAHTLVNEQTQLPQRTQTSDTTHTHDSDKEDGQDDEDSNADGSDGQDEEDELGEDALYDHLLSLDTNLNDMREQFIAKPKEVMQRIQSEDPTLFRLISANQEAFVRLINSEAEVRALQEEKEMTHDDYDEEGYEEDDVDEEGGYDAIDEAVAQSIHNTYMQLLNRDALAEAVTRADSPHTSGADNNDGTSNEVPAATTATLPDNYDAYAPSEAEEEKIQSLVQLGFNYAQAKNAFYKCRRSLERAANFLFESTPQL